MPKSYALKPLVVQEVAAMDGFTHVATITAGDATQATANTAQTFDLGPIPAGSGIQVEIRNTIPFQDTADSAFNSNTLSIGDTGSATSLLAAQQLNKNGTFITVARGAMSAVYTTANTLRVTLNAMAAKSLANLNKGQVDILVKIQNPNPLLNVKGPVSFSK